MFDPRLLRSFVAIADSGNFTHAAERLNMTQSTISQQIGRLEAMAGHRLVDRSARPVCLTAMGERLIGHARRILLLNEDAALLLRDPAGTAAISIGLPEDLATGAMAQAFAGFARAHRHIRLDATTGLSRDLAQRYRQGEFDIVIVKEAVAGPDCRASFAEPLGWFTAEESGAVEAAALPLVCFPAGGLYREAMFAQLEREGRRWFVAFSGSSLQSVVAAVAAGVGASLLPLAGVGGAAVVRRRDLGGVAPMLVSLYAREGDGPLANLGREMIAVLAARAG
ncbi:MAG: LuxR family transcriptional regulator [Sphingobium sp.]|nr:LuxR family transcriptional regulator [Sphingobium sp.]